MTLEVDGNVSVVPLPGRHQPAISCLDNYSPNGCETQRCGVRIDPPVFPTPEGALAGRDEVLERALQPASAQFPDGRPFAAAPMGRGGRNCFSTSHPHHLFHLSRITPNRNYRAHSAVTPPYFPRRPRLARQIACMRFIAPYFQIEIHTTIYTEFLFTHNGYK